MPRILVALDDSCGSEKALQAAVQLAQRDGGQLTAVTVLERAGDPVAEQLAEDVNSQAMQRLEELLQTAANFAHSRGLRLRPILREGQPAETILICAKEERANLVVLGAGRLADGGNPGLGNTADEVSKRCPCTVLIAR
jgi:nucleotide-binding universal stress UspA family protein